MLSRCVFNQRTLFFSGGYLILTKKKKKKKKKIPANYLPTCLKNLTQREECAAFMDLSYFTVTPSLKDFSVRVQEEEEEEGKRSSLSYLLWNVPRTHTREHARPSTTTEHLLTCGRSLSVCAPPHLSLFLCVCSRERRKYQRERCLENISIPRAHARVTAGSPPHHATRVYHTLCKTRVFAKRRTERTWNRGEKGKEAIISCLVS